MHGVYTNHERIEPCPHGSWTMLDCGVLCSICTLSPCLPLPLPNNGYAALGVNSDSNALIRYPVTSQDPGLHQGVCRVVA